MPEIDEIIAQLSSSKALPIALAEVDRLLSYQKVDDYRPYPKQVDFHDAGRIHSERLFIAGNQLGKTLAGGAEWAFHLTGRYPSWWNGAVFDKPVTMWASGVTNEGTRDNPQRILIGPPTVEKAWGTGMIPKSALSGWNRAMGTPNLLDNATIRWGGGGDVQAGVSILNFKSYEKGREKWQGPTIDGVWFDEECPLEIYTEGLTRTNNGQRGQFAIMTFTPLLGMSEVVRMFLMPEAGSVVKGRHVTTMTIYDVDHYSDAEREKIIASYPAHQRDARAKGIPTLGSGRIFPVEEESIKIAAFPIPAHWAQINGLDFGWDHPSAAARLAWDRDSDVIYVTSVHRAAQQTPVLFAPAVKAWGEWIPCAWPHDGLQHDKGSGEELAGQYRATGLNMLEERATWEDGSNGVEAGVLEMLDRMQTGRFKVFSHLELFFEEFRLYHRKDGKIVKLMDDILSACLHPETEVITSEGVRAIADLVGTSGLVLSTEGRWQPYKNCRLTRADAEVVRVVFSDGHDIVCTPDHKLLTDSGEWVPAIDAEGIICHDAVSRRGDKQQKIGEIISKTLRVQSVKPAGRSDVFCMEVENTHAFAVANGVIVHNCRYAIMMKREARVAPREERRERKRDRNWKTA